MIKNHQFCDKIKIPFIHNAMEKEKKSNIKIICIKAPKWSVPFLKMFYKKKDKEEKTDS